MKHANTQKKAAISLANRFLVATPRLQDSQFSQSVVFICEHNEHGAMGIIVNKLAKNTLGTILDQLAIETNHEDVREHPVLQGGPLGQEQGFVLYEDDTIDAEEENDNLVLSASKDILSQFAKHEGPKNILVSLGYASWGAGQIEQELLDNAWLIAPCDHEILFNMPFHQRWRAVAHRIGFDFDQFSGDVGHA